MLIKIEGAAHYLPAYAGNLDIMISAGLRTVERIALSAANRGSRMMTLLFSGNAAYRRESGEGWGVAKY